jgi:hypothetical protein
MAGPLNGIGGQQIPLATPYQPGQNGSQVRQQTDREPQPNRVSPPGAQAAQSQESETRNSRDLRSLLQDTEALPQRARGNVVDLTI